MTTILKVDGMSCQNCVRHVREALQSVPNIDSVTVTLEKAEAIVKWKGENITENDLIKSLDAAGYPSEIITTSG